MPDRSLAEAWTNLAARSKAAPYLDAGWLDCWWPAFGEGELEVHTLYRGNRLAAVMPLASRPGQLESAANYHTPVAGMIAEDATAGASLAWEIFREAPARVTLTALEPNGMTLQCCRPAAKELGFRVILRPHLVSPYVDLSQGWDAYRRSLHSHLLRNLRRGWRQLEALGPVKVEVVSDRRGLQERLAKALRVEGSGWKGQMRTAILSRPHTRDFYERMTAWAADRGVLRLYLLTLGDRLLTMCLTLQQHDNCCMLKGGYDEEFKRFSPGNLLTEKLIEDCAGRGIKQVDIYGEAETYKMNWATGTRQCLRFEAFAPTVAGQMAWMDFKYRRPLTSRVRQALGMQQPGHRQ